ncbi:MAG: hypothetical protein M1824_005860 [Vezdaea acicularis]|nr:MAG: hypothetical protein M1824_005860 [Vezdaea acicularis]
MPSAARQTKRPFQPSITSFFARPDRDDYQHDYARRLADTPFPPLPAQTQASLLNVGMRVRKSVPEGYKTDPSEDFGFARMEGGEHNGPMNSDCVERRHSAPGIQMAGLTPYCGIMKVGGLSSQSSTALSTLNQPINIFTDPTVATAQSSIDLSNSTSATLSLRQTSTSSTLSFVEPCTPPANPHKRPYDPETAEDASYHPFVWDEANNLQPVSPRTRPVSHTHMPNLNNIRPMATPKTRRKDPFKNVNIWGNEENKSIRRGAIAEVDFEDADFLSADAWEISEVQMSDV